MRLTSQAQYAIFALFDLAYNGDDKPQQVRLVGQRQAIPERYLEQIFRRLRQANLVTSKRGPGGGYRLARDAVNISLAEIVRALDGDQALLSLAKEEKGAGRPAFLAFLLEERIEQVLSEMSLEWLCQQARRHGVPRAMSSESEELMYFI